MPRKSVVMRESSDRDFPQRWADISELCARGATRALVDHWIRSGQVYALSLGSMVWYSLDQVEEFLASDASERLGGPATACPPILPRCNKSGNVLR